jgi:hypothetical protein
VLFGMRPNAVRRAAILAIATQAKQGGLIVIPDCRGSGKSGIHLR